MTTETIERSYQLTKIGAGDWLLPSNDARTLWRLRTYDEDGSATYQKDYTPGRGPSGRHYVLRGTFWAVWRWDGAFPSPDALADALELDDWTRWDFWEGTLRTRSDAIQSALRSRP